MTHIEDSLYKLTQLTDGWFDGFYGKHINESPLTDLIQIFEKFYDKKLTLPAIFPTIDGNIQFEWSLNDYEISLYVEIESKKGELYLLNTINKTEILEELNLNIEKSWIKLNQLINFISL